MAPTTKSSTPSDQSEKSPTMLSSACTDAQRSGFLDCSVTAIGALQDAIATLTERQAMLDLGSDERQLITVELAELKAREAKIWGHMRAFIAGKQAVRPPIQADLDKVKELAKKLDSLTAQATMTKAVLDATTQIVVLYNRSIDV
jgi:uncharacterized protein YPO0396